MQQIKAMGGIVLLGVIFTFLAIYFLRPGGGELKPGAIALIVTICLAAASVVSAGVRGMCGLIFGKKEAQP